MKFPSYADWRNRTPSECSTLVSPRQTRILINMVVKEYGPLQNPFAKLRELLLNDGWSVVEKHGDRLFLRAVLVYGGISEEDAARFKEHAAKTGNWSFADWRAAEKAVTLKIIK